LPKKATRGLNEPLYDITPGFMKRFQSLIDEGLADAMHSSAGSTPSGKLGDATLKILDMKADTRSVGFNQTE
jgi:hypothetical protein